jgi:hypothetical protein
MIFQRNCQSKMFTSVENFQSRRMFGIEVFPFCRVGLKSLEVLNMLGL